jgi:hypothetical protein
LFKNAELTAVTTDRITRIRNGRPPPSRTALPAVHWNRPVSRMTLAIAIMPINRKMTFQSTARKA